jgi:hypothetical protein
MFSRCGAALAALGHRGAAIHMRLMEARVKVLDRFVEPLAEGLLVRVQPEEPCSKIPTVRVRAGIFGIGSSHPVVRVMSSRYIQVSSAGLAPSRWTLNQSVMVWPL